jgi:predicted  nucleic acid-binding Zn-ribbon protein
MSLDNRFRIGELTQSGSRAVISQDSTSKSHTFISDSKTIVLGKEDGGDAPYTHIKGERDGELTAYVEKPAYKEEQLKKAVDTVIDELVLPPKKEQPDVVPRPVYDELEDKFQQALADLEKAQQRILQLEGQVAQLTAELQATRVENDSLKIQKAIVDNQFQQSTERYKESISKLGTAIVKATKEANERVRLNAQVEGLVAQKDVLRQELLSLRKIVSGLEGQVEAGVDSLRAQTEAAKAQREAQAAAAEAQRLALQNQQEALESQLSGQAAETQAAAAGLAPMSDNESYYGVKSTEASSSDLKWTTSVDNPKPGKAGNLTIQNLKDTGAKITQVSISVSGRISEYSGTILGFSNDTSPTNSKIVTVNKGSKTELPLYFKKKIGGRNKPEPDKSNFLNSAKDYSGSFVITARYDDGTTTKTSSLSWAIRKNKK